jgi:type VII secretion integral membrane protein EccD
VSRVDAGSFVKVLVVAPRTRVDVALPVDVPLLDLMPLLLEMVGERHDGTTSAHDWRLERVGAGPLDAARSLRSLDVLDGTVLQLSSTASVPPEPVYDDVVDAIARAVDGRIDRSSLRDAAGALAAGAGLLVAAYVLATGGHTAGHAGLAGAAAVAVLVAAGGLARAGAGTMLAVAVAACGTPLAFVAGLLLVGGGLMPALLLGSALALAHSVLALVLVGAGATVFSAASTVAAFGSLAGLGAVLLGGDLGQAATLSSAAALGSLSLHPWLAVRLSRLPAPVIPVTPDDLRDIAASVDFSDVSRRAVLASEYLDGLLTGSAVVTAAGAAVAIAGGSGLDAGYGVVALGALLLRVRSVPGRLPRIVLLVTGIAGLAIGAAAFSRTLPGASALGIVVVVLLLGAAAVLVTVAAPRRRLSPMTSRSLDFAESILLVAVIPLAIAAAGLYSAARHW